MNSTSNGKSWDIMDLAKALESISYLRPLRLRLLLYVMFLKLSGDRTLGTQKVKVGIYYYFSNIFLEENKYI